MAMTTHGNRGIRSFWIQAPFVPPKGSTLQSSGVCFTDAGKVVIVHDGRNWQLPGGAVESGETPEDALIREIMEEACARVVDKAYLGCIRQEERAPGVGESPSVLYKARFWARVKMETFRPRFEIVRRAEVPPDRLIGYLSWNARKTAKNVLRDAIFAERKMKTSQGAAE